MLSIIILTSFIFLECQWNKFNKVFAVTIVVIMEAMAMVKQLRVTEKWNS